MQPTQPPATTTDNPSAHPPRTVLHRRAYDIESYVEDAAHFRLVGFLRDTNPTGLWGIADTEPLVLHHMQLELVVQAAAYPGVHAASLHLTQLA